MSKEEKTARLPNSLSTVEYCLKDFKPPTGPFNPAGNWDLKYSIWLVFPTAPGELSQFANANLSRPVGTLHISRKSVKQGASEFSINQTNFVGGQFASKIDAHVLCSDDLPTTPKSWKLESRFYDTKGNSLEYISAAVRQTGKFMDGTIYRQMKTTHQSYTSNNLTSNWLIFDTLQRLPVNRTKALNFDMLEDMELLKQNQRLIYDRPVDVTIAGNPIKLHRFLHMGQGNPIYEYWLDDQRRCLIAAGLMRAFILEPSENNKQ